MRGLALTLRAWQLGVRSHSGGGTLEQQQQVWGPRTAAYTSPGHPGLRGRAHIPPTVSSICQQSLQIYLPNLPKRDLVETFPHYGLAWYAP